MVLSIQFFVSVIPLLPDNKLYLLLYGNAYGAPDGKPFWHFPEKVYKNEETMRLCAETALKSVIGGLDNTYFVGNAPMAHMVVEQPDSNVSSFKKYHQQKIHCITSTGGA